MHKKSLVATERLRAKVRRQRDDWATHRNKEAAQALRDHGCWFLYPGESLPRFKSNTCVVSAAMVGKVLPQKFHGARATGSAGWNCYHVIRGSFGAFVSPSNLRCWDIQSGACLALEAGCSVRLNGAL